MAKKVARDAITQQKQEQRDRYDKLARPQIFRAGDTVVILRPIPAGTGLPRKLIPIYEGPYRVESVRHKVANLTPLLLPNDPRTKRLRPTAAPFDRLKLANEDRFMEAEVPMEADHHLEEDIPEAAYPSPNGADVDIGPYGLVARQHQLASIFIT